MSRKKTISWVVVAISALTIGLSSRAVQAASQEIAVINLTQTGCQFLEPEGVDHKFRTTAAADCEAINAKSAEQRLAEAKTLELTPGTYIFRVTNKNVPYELGFYLRGVGFGRLTLPRVSGGGLLPGTTRDYEIELKEGEYRFSCPLNPTPDYTLVVKPKA